MFTIHLTHFDPVMMFAAEELKKYLHMMMLEQNHIQITVNPQATEGFRLGLLEEFSLSTEEVKDSFFDDVVHIDTTGEGGILAGSNPRSVLFAVYRFLRLNGCRFLFPYGRSKPLNTISWQTTVCAVTP